MESTELPSLMHVRAFVRVADHGSVSKASVALYRAQSVVTRSIAELETRLAVPLFERHANGMRLTDDGEHLLPVHDAYSPSWKACRGCWVVGKNARSSRFTCSRPDACRCSSNSVKRAICRRSPACSA